MNLNIVKVISTSLESAVRFVKVLRMGKSDVQNVKEISSYGIDGNPIKDMIAIYGATGTNGKNYIIGYINKNQIAQPGELRLYSTDDDGKETTYQYFKKDKTIEIFGNDDNMVRYSKLEIAFNELKGQHNKTDANLVAHAAAVALILGTPTVSPSTSTADITGAKIVDIKTKSK